VRRSRCSLRALALRGNPVGDDGATAFAEVRYAM
jgi:hypothetical protein